ncbi:MAG: glycerate kinase family protein [Jatrophihabitans sp.]|uniref:glycerate kinase family protein n=1 Tax=Jatrophihabitans sp. TaxID=1932789 RepID=UPI003F811355
MRVLAAPDKFRGTLTAADVVAAIAAACRDLGVECVGRPMADGGEGLLDALGGGNRVDVVTGPLGAPVRAAWRYDTRTHRAVIESAAACGLHLVGDGNDPERATTAGVGELLVAAARAGAEHVLLGLGGSATTDGGQGALRALEAAGLADAFGRVRLDVACDVRTPFTRAAEVFGPQKGADDATVARLTQRLERLRDEVRARRGLDLDLVPGSGAAGGLAGGLVTVGARLLPGADLVAEEVGLDSLIADADLVIPGDGRLDRTSLAGMVVWAVVARARAGDRPVVVIAGAVEPGLEVPGAVVRSLVDEHGADRAWRHAAGALEETTRAVVAALR